MKSRTPANGEWKGVHSSTNPSTKRASDSSWILGLVDSAIAAPRRTPSHAFSAPPIVGKLAAFQYCFWPVGRHADRALFAQVVATPTLIPMAVGS